LRQFVVDTVTEKIAEKAAKQADKIALKAAHHAKHLDRLTAHLDALDVWTRVEPGRRRSRFTRAEIATVALEIADAEGLEAVSMRRIATELGAGTMTLYHYVRTKDELLALLTDAVMGEVVVPPDQPLPDDWREAISTIARRSRDGLRKHPWILDIADDPAIGPNSVRHFDQSMQAVASLPGTLTDKLDAMTAVDEYVFGFCIHERNDFHDSSELDGGNHMLEYVKELVATGDYPELAKMAEDHDGLDSLWAQSQAHAADESRFDRNLARLLDGIERSLPS
ncbi:MAG TPA: TetR/AcrR family transcriptional regulator, partial [Acidimicrobiia bacterium]